MSAFIEGALPAVPLLGKQVEQLLSLDSLAVAPPPAIESASSSSDETSSILSRSSSSSVSNIDSSTFASAGSYTCSSASFTNGQLTPPFSASSNSSSLDIADQHHGDFACTSAGDAVADTLEERVDGTRGSTSQLREAISRRQPCHSSPFKADQVPRSEVRRYAAEIVRKEAKALLELAARLDPEPTIYEQEPLSRLKPAKEQDSFSNAVEILRSMDSHGRIIMTGVGKSGLLARKAVATFNSFGIPSAFLHPVEALHGDLGLLSPYGVDTVILISYSGRTSELLHLLQHLRRRRIHSCISLSSPDSALAEACDVNIDVSLENDEEAEESVPAPTSSVLTALAALDALALTLLRLKTGWHAHVSERRKTFGLHHPGGSLGQQLSPSAQQT